MDAVKVLGGLLSQRSGRSGGSGQILGQVLNGIAAAKPREEHPDPRFAPHHHEPFEQIVRDSVSRHHHAGGRLSPHASQWAKQHGARYQQPSIRRVPKPQPGIHPGHDHQPHHDHHPHAHPSGLAYNQRAELLIRAMIMAAQADGRIDPLEQDRIVDSLQPLDPFEVEYLRREFNRPHDVHAFVHEVPNGMEYEIYQVSLMAIDLDTQFEVNYLRALAKCLRIDGIVCNQIHQRCGARCLY